MSEKYYQAIGRRKTAIAQVRLYPVGSGKVTINNKDMKEYFDTEQMCQVALLPLKEVGKLDTVDITVRAVGGGKVGQVDAVKMAIARALVKYDESLKTVIKTQGFLTRDARKKERKKF